MNDNLLQKYEIDGYILVRDVIDLETMQSLRNLLEYEFDKSGTNVLYDSILMHPKILNLLFLPRLCNTLTSLLGHPFVVVPQTSAEYNRFGYFHTDTTGAEASGQIFHHQKEFRIVTVAIYLQDNDEYGGGIRLGVGSHKKPDPYIELNQIKELKRKKYSQSKLKQLIKKISRNRLFDWNTPFYERSDGLDILSKAGDVVIWDMRLAHRASPKRRSGISPQGNKIGIFLTCGANNHITTGEYMDYVLSAPGNEFLKKRRCERGAKLYETHDFFVL